MLEAYCWPRSVEPGETVAIHASTDVDRFDVVVARDGATLEEVWSGTGAAGLHAVSEDASSVGCGWPAALEVPADERWRSGYYAVTLTSGDERADAFFVVRSRPQEAAPILMVLSTATYDAYNDWGGPSLYTGGTQVSSERPLAAGFLVKPEPHRRKMQPLPDREGLWFFEWAERLGLSVWTGGAGWWNWERRVLALRPRRPTSVGRLHGLPSRPLDLRGDPAPVRGCAGTRRFDRRLRGRRVRAHDRCGGAPGPDPRGRRPRDPGGARDGAGSIVEARRAADALRERAWGAGARGRGRVRRWVGGERVSRGAQPRRPRRLHDPGRRHGRQRRCDRLGLRAG